MFNISVQHGTLFLTLWNYKFLRGYIQGFTGYGQSLLDYDSNQTSVGVGVSIMDFM